MYVCCVFVNYYFQSKFLILYTLQSESPSNCGQYKQPHCDIVFTKYRSVLYHAQGMVIGTQYPWAEAAILGKLVLYVNVFHNLIETMN